jgi:CubicO group peptidase (beta-lactamase class C family)
MRGRICTAVLSIALGASAYGQQAAPQATRPPANNNTLHAAIVAKLQPFIDRHEVAGVVTEVASRDSVLDVATLGYMEVGAKKPMSGDALFWIASMSKPITAVAFMTLVDEHKAALDDPVSKYIPSFQPNSSCSNPEPAIRTRTRGSTSLAESSKW